MEITMKQTKLKFDIMLRDKFIATMRVPTQGLIFGYDEYGKPIPNKTAVHRLVESKRPTLKNQPYKLFFD